MRRRLSEKIGKGGGGILFFVFMVISCDAITKNHISGRTTLNGQPLAEVAISIMPQGETISLTTKSDASGVYSFSKVPSGSYTIIPSKEGVTFLPESYDFSISSDDRLEAFDFTAAAINPDEKIKIILTGDINMGNQVGQLVESQEAGDYRFLFQQIGDYLRDADLTIGNLESIISDQGISTKKSLGIALRANPDAVHGLTFAGFDIMTVANNHLGDYDFEGMTDSFARLRNAGIDYVGGGLNFDEAHSPVIKTINGTKIAVLAYSNVPMYMDTTGAYSPTPKWIARGDRPGLAWAHDSRFEMYGDLAQMNEDILYAKSLSDIVIVTVHFGWEYNDEPDEEQKEFARSAIDAGASLVIGHHPHVQQPVEMYKGKCIAYSLGNFLFDISEQMATGTTKGMVIEAIIENRQIVEIHQTFTRTNEQYQVEFDDQ